jgi:hypothetical protein
MDVVDDVKWRDKAGKGFHGNLGTGEVKASFQTRTDRKWKKIDCAL